MHWSSTEWEAWIRECHRSWWECKVLFSCVLQVKEARQIHFLHQACFFSLVTAEQIQSGPADTQKNMLRPLSLIFLSISHTFLQRTWSPTGSWGHSLLLVFCPSISSTWKWVSDQLLLQGILPVPVLFIQAQPGLPQAVYVSLCLSSVERDPSFAEGFRWNLGQYVEVTASDFHLP